MMYALDGIYDAQILALAYEGCNQEINNIENHRGILEDSLLDSMRDGILKQQEIIADLSKICTSSNKSNLFKVVNGKLVIEIGDRHIYDQD